MPDFVTKKASLRNPVTFISTIGVCSARALERCEDWHLEVFKTLGPNPGFNCGKLDCGLVVRRYMGQV